MSLLTTETVAAYVAALGSDVFTKDANLVATEVLGGNLNYAFQVYTSVCIGTAAQTYSR